MRKGGGAGEVEKEGGRSLHALSFVFGEAGFPWIWGWFRYRELVSCFERVLENAWFCYRMVDRGFSSLIG